MAYKPNNPFGRSDRLTRFTAITLIGAGALGLTGCINGEAQAEKPPTSTSGEVTPGPTTPAATETVTAEPTTTETEQVNEALVGVIDTTGLDPAAVEFAKGVTPEALYAMSTEERAAALTITPEMYGDDTDIAAQLLFSQYAAMVGLATNADFIQESLDTNGFGNLEAYTQVAKDLIDSVHGEGTSVGSETAVARFVYTAQHAESVQLIRDNIVTSPEAKSVPDYTVWISSPSFSADTIELIGGDIRNAAAGVEMDIVITQPNDYTAIGKDPSYGSTVGLEGDGSPTVQPGIITFTSTKERSGELTTMGISLRTE